jgi:hypothetical protein
MAAHRPSYELFALRSLDTVVLASFSLRLMQRITQHSVKLIRWVAAQLWANIPWQQACAVLIALYAKL